MSDSAVLSSAIRLVQRGAEELVYETLALEPRKSSSKKKPKKSKKVKLRNGGTIDNWKLALIIVGSILGACLIAFAIWWFYKKKKAKKAREDEEALKPEKYGSGGME